MVGTDRYVGKPLVRILELYVLWSIDELSEEHAKTLSDMTPRLQSLYSREGSWNEVIASMMEFPDNLPATFRQMWARNTEIAAANGAVLTPQQFAEMVVDENFPIDD
jgi:hypothetical protein